MHFLFKTCISKQSRDKEHRYQQTHPAKFLNPKSFPSKKRFQTKPQCVEYKLVLLTPIKHTPTEAGIPRTGFRLVQSQKQTINVLLVHAILELWMPPSPVFQSSFMSFPHFFLLDWGVWMSHGFGEPFQHDVHSNLTRTRTHTHTETMEV